MVGSIYKYKGESKDWYYKKETNNAQDIIIEKTINDKGFIEDYKETHVIAGRKSVVNIFHNEYDDNDQLSLAVCNNEKTVFDRNPKDCPEIPGESYGKPDEVVFNTTVNCGDNGFTTEYAVAYIKKLVGSITCANLDDGRDDITVNYDQIIITMHYSSYKMDEKYPSKENATYIEYEYYLKGVPVYMKGTNNTGEVISDDYYEYNDNLSITYHLHHDNVMKMLTEMKFEYDSEFFHGRKEVKSVMETKAYKSSTEPLIVEIGFVKDDKGVWNNSKGRSYVFNKNGDVEMEITNQSCTEYKYTDDGNVYFMQEYPTNTLALESKKMLSKEASQMANNESLIAAYKFYDDGQVQLEATNMHGDRTMTHYITDNKGRVISVVRYRAETDVEKELIDSIIETIKNQ